MGVFYDVRVHLAENPDDYVGKKGTTVSMGIKKAQFASPDLKQRSPTSTAEKGFMLSCGSGKGTVQMKKSNIYYISNYGLYHQ